jgi:Trypsin-like peptidase domain
MDKLFTVTEVKWCRGQCLTMKTWFLFLWSLMVVGELCGEELGAAGLVQLHRSNLVMVRGLEGSGSGFVAALGGENFLFTNAHVVAGIKGAGFTTLDGVQIKVERPSIAVGHDLFRIGVAGGGKPLEVMLEVDRKVAIGDDVVVLGNAEGGGVVNLIRGHLVGIGPQLVEVDAPFLNGNSGSPIIHLKTGQVIGVATYLTIKRVDAATHREFYQPVVRRFGYRVDSVKVWQPVVWGAFYAQAGEIGVVEKLTEDLGKFLIDVSRKGRVDSGAHTNPAIRMRIDQWEKDKRKKMSERDATAVDQNFLGFLRSTCRADVIAAQPRMTYDYFQRKLSEQQRDRGEMAEIFDKMIKELQTGR